MKLQRSVMAVVANLAQLVVLGIFGFQLVSLLLSGEQSFVHQDLVIWTAVVGCACGLLTLALEGLLPKIIRSVEVGLYFVWLAGALLGFILDSGRLLPSIVKTLLVLSFFMMWNVSQITWSICLFWNGQGRRYFRLEDLLNGINIFVGRQKLDQVAAQSLAQSLVERLRQEIKEQSTVSRAYLLQLFQSAERSSGWGDFLKEVLEGC